MTVERLSQSWPLTVAMVRAIEARTSLAAILASPGIYNGQAPISAPYPYITLGLAQESEDIGSAVFGRAGTTAGQVLDIWGRKRVLSGATLFELGDREVKQIYGELRALFHEQPLVVAGFDVVRGTIALLATAEDPDGETIHAIVRYDVISYQTGVA